MIPPPVVNTSVQFGNANYEIEWREYQRPADYRFDRLLIEVSDIDEG
jgi:hypothetical protein